MIPAKPRLLKPLLESLETRLTPTSYVANNELFIVCGNASDTVTVNIQYRSSYGYYCVTENGRDSLFLTSKVRGGVSFYGYQGNDYFANNTNLRTIAYGHDGNDTLIGGTNNDFLYGEVGQDYLYGRGGNDILVGGNDYSYNFLSGGDGYDTLTGGYGTDDLYGGNDADVLYGNYGNDFLFGEGGQDTLYGQDGDDVLRGGRDGFADRLWGGAGYDTFEMNLMAYSSTNWYNLDAPADFGYGGDTYI